MKDIQMRVLVCGSRDFTDVDFIFETLDQIEAELGPFNRVIQGGARGVDRIASQWAVNLNIPQEEYRAQWNELGKAAGPIRNKQMLDEGKPDLVIAFLAPNSRGTKNMIDQATKAGVPVKVINI